MRVQRTRDAGKIAARDDGTQARRAEQCRNVRFLTDAKLYHQVPVRPEQSGACPAMVR